MELQTEMDIKASTHIVTCSQVRFMPSLYLNEKVILHVFILQRQITLPL